MNLAQLTINVIIAAAAVGILLVCLKAFGIAVPAFVITIFWIVVCAAIGILAIRWLMGMKGPGGP